MNVCVIGLGSMGKRRIKLLKNSGMNLTITGIDNNKERARAVADEYGIDISPSLGDMKLEADCAFVCTSPRSHGEIIRECLERNMHVFSELNLVNDLYEENMQTAGEKGKVLFLSSTPLYKAEMQIIDNKVKESREVCAYQYHIGQYLPDWHPWDNLKNIFISDKRTNGCRELLAYELPWIQHTFGAVKKVNVIRKKLTKLDIDFPDTYLVQIEHASGNAGNLVIDVVSRQAARHLEVFGENLYLSWNGTPDSLYEKDVMQGEFRQIPAGEYIHERGYEGFINEYAYAKEIEEFFAVIGGKKPVYGFAEDRETLRVIDEIEAIN